MCIWLLQGRAPPSFLMLVVEILQVDYVHLESDTRAVWQKERADLTVLQKERADLANQTETADSPIWHKQEVNP